MGSSRKIKCALCKKAPPKSISSTYCKACCRKRLDERNSDAYLNVLLQKIDAGTLRVGGSNKTILDALKADTDECILWPGYVQRNGYVQVEFRGRRGYAHRLVTELYTRKPIPPGKQVLHGPCDNKKCINPRHLRVGTLQENLRERDERNPYPRVSGKRLSEAEVILIRRLNAEGVPKTVIARVFERNHQTIRYVTQGRSYKRVGQYG